MDIEKEREAFEREMLGSGYVAGNISAFWDEKTQNYDIAITELRMAWKAWQSAKAQAVPYESCSIKSHEIIINETKSELIDGYDIAKEDEYLLESLVYRGVCIGKAQAVPEKDAVIKKLSDQLYEQEMKTSAARVLCETACELLDDYAHQDAMVILNDLEQAMSTGASQ